MEDIIFNKVGERLKEAREIRHITLEEAGKKVGVHKSTILRWENGETEKIKLPIIETLADYYNVNPSWLMGHDVPMDKPITIEMVDISVFEIFLKQSNLNQKEINEVYRFIEFLQYKKGILPKC